MNPPITEGSRCQFPISQPNFSLFAPFFRLALLECTFAPATSLPGLSRLARTWFAAAMRTPWRTADVGGCMLLDADAAEHFDKKI